MEIKNTELRIGNYLMDKVSKTILKVDELGGVGFDDHIHVYYKEPRDNNSCWNLVGIPLTEETLLKCSFVFSGVVQSIGYFRLIYEDGGKLFFYSHAMLRVEVKYLHQLQNLYFFCAGKELQINL